MTTDYTAPGKQDFRDLLLAVARHSECRSYGTFWGTGIDSRLFALAGFDVVAAEVTRAKHELMSEDAATGGYRAFRGRAGKLREHVDMFHADFDGGPSPANFREVRRIAAISDRWLAVTLSMDHQRDESMMGEAAFYTIPAWLTGASEFTLEYLSRYKRNEYGQTMWVALLQRRTGKGNSHRVQPLQVQRGIERRGYWASKALYDTRLLPHTQPVPSEYTVARQRNYYLENREAKLAWAKDYHAANRERGNEASRRWREANPERQRAATARWYEAHKNDPEQVARRKAYRKEWYAKNREKQLASVKAWREKNRSIVARPAEPSSSEKAA